MSKNDIECTLHFSIYTIKYCFQKGEKDALDERMNKPLSPRRKSPEKKNVASLQVEVIFIDLQRNW